MDRRATAGELREKIKTLTMIIEKMGEKLRGQRKQC